MATTWMAGTLGAGARLRVQIAWGADLAAAEATWTWTDITADVRQADQIVVTIGRGDEAGVSQPAQCSMRLDNTTGAYSLGGQSSNWPNVRRNTPLRVQVDPSASGAAYVTRFVGNVVGFVPAWDVTGNDATVVLTAAGTLRRLAQGAAPAQSSFRRAVLGSIATSGIKGYWPCEEGPDAIDIASGIGGADMRIGIALPEFEANNSFACSGLLPRLNGARYDGPIPPYADTNNTQMRALVDFPGGGDATGTVILAVSGQGTAPFWQLRNQAGGDVEVRAYNTAWAVLLTTTIDFNLDGRRGQLGLQLTQSGADINWSCDFLELGAGASTGASGTLAGRTFNNASLVGVNTDGLLNDIAVGHVTLGTVLTSETQNIVELNAYNGEHITSSTGRIARLATENAVTVTRVDDAASGLATQLTDQAGPQRIGTFVDLLRECEVADQGILYDGLSAGLTYVTRRRRFDSDALMTIDASAGRLAAFDPVDDDQRTRNMFVGTRKGGASTTVTDTSGPLGTAAIGVYDDTVVANTYRDTSAGDYAGWLVHKGTIEGYRYPTLSLDFARNPSLAASWLTMTLGRRIDVTNVSTARTQHPTGTVSLALEGYTEVIDQFRWNVTMVCSSYEAWRVTELAAASGDTNEYITHLDTDASTLNGAETAGSTSFSVTTTTGPIWTTDADDVPFDIEVGGIRITVTAISGAASPQTFTVTGSTVTKNLASGLAVKVWHPPVLSI